MTDKIERLEKEVIAALSDGYLSCPAALALSRRLGVSSTAIGETVDTLGIRIIDCQLGCFKVEKATHDDLEGRDFSEEVINGIRESISGGQLACKDAHELGARLRVNIKEIGDTATRMKIRIKDCQLGCFA